jgi:hypothetical protein
VSRRSEACRGYRRGTPLCVPRPRFRCAWAPSGRPVSVITSSLARILRPDFTESKEKNRVCRDT